MNTHNLIRIVSGEVITTGTFEHCEKRSRKFGLAAHFSYAIVEAEKSKN